MDTPTKSPAQQGYAMPAEWHRHEATWLAWPHHKADWPGKFAPIPWIFAEIVRHIAAAEKVHLLVQDAAEQAKAQRTLERGDVSLENIVWHRKRTDRIWTRDSAPSFVVKQAGRGEGKVGAVGWHFNAWAKYDNYKQDCQLPTYVAKALKLPLWKPTIEAEGKARTMVLEGGSIDVDGSGSVLTTEECLLSEVQQRNPGANRDAVERALRDYLGVRQVLWLDRGIAGDDTHGHIDDTARFTSADTIAACVEPNRNDANHEPLAENLKRLKAMRSSAGRPFNIVELPLPEPVVFDGQRLPASYANFYVCNAGVLVPVFNDAADGVALRLLEECFEQRRKVIPIYCRDLVWGLGTLHCMTQQQPAAIA